MSIKFRPNFKPAVVASLALLLGFMVVALWLVQAIQSPSGIVDSLPNGLVPFLRWAGFAAGLAGLAWMFVSRRKNRPTPGAAIILLTAGICLVLLSQVLSLAFVSQGR